VSDLGEEKCRKFVRQLDKDINYKVSYIKLTDKICSLGNKDHNPLRSMLERLTYFLDTNKLTILSLLNKLGNPKEISVQKFAEFLVAKVDKRKQLSLGLHLATQIDIDKDGMINEQDLRTCLNNINCRGFFEKVGT
jgi:hypothetical protein